MFNQVLFRREYFIVLIIFPSTLSTQVVKFSYNKKILYIKSYRSIINASINVNNDIIIINGLKEKLENGFT